MYNCWSCGPSNSLYIYFTDRFLETAYRIGNFVTSSFSFVHSIGPKYRRECLPYLMVLNLGKLKSLFRRVYADCFRLKISLKQFGASPFFTLYTYRLQCLVIFYCIMKGALPLSKMLHMSVFLLYLLHTVHAPEYVRSFVYPTI